MDKEMENEENVQLENIAKIGDTIEFTPSWSNEPIQGSVTTINENSVIVQLKNPKDTEDGEYKNTVVNHKKYKIIT